MSYSIVFLTKKASSVKLDYLLLSEFELYQNMVCTKYSVYTTYLIYSWPVSGTLVIPKKPGVSGF